MFHQSSCHKMRMKLLSDLHSEMFYYENAMEIILDKCTDTVNTLSKTRSPPSDGNTYLIFVIKNK